MPLTEKWTRPPSLKSHPHSQVLFQRASGSARVHAQSLQGHREESRPVNSKNEDRASLFLLLSLLLYVLVGTFIEDDRLAEGFLLLSLYVTLLAATIYLSSRRGPQLFGLLLALAVGVVTSLVLFRPTPLLAVVFWTLLAIFFAFVIAGLLGHLGKPGPVTAGRLYIAASLYLLVGVFWFALYNLLEATYPGSFGQPGSSQHIHPRSLLYFSLETITTLGYGDIVPVSPKARSLAVLEAVAGVLYIAVAVSRLVAGYQSGYQVGDRTDSAPRK
jgi:voltage-gated potassium channel